MKHFSKITSFSLSLISVSLFSISCSEIDEQLEISQNRDLESEIKNFSDKNARPSDKQQMYNDIDEKLRDRYENDKSLKQTEKELAEAKAQLIAEQIKKEELARKLKEEREEEARVTAELKEIKEKQAIQKLAWKKYIGTEYPELELGNGKILKNLKATEVRATHVTFSHSAGIANVQFKDLKGSIKRACKYDPKLASLAKEKQAELQRRIKNRLLAEQESENSKAKSSANSGSKPARNPRTSLYVNQKAKSSNSTTAHNKYINKAKAIATASQNNKVVTPRGSLKVKVVGVDHIRSKSYYNDGHTTSRYYGVKKTIKVMAWANVDAEVTVHSNRFSVKAGETTTREFNLTSNKYTVTLRDKNGKLLDQEKHNRKTGL